MTERPRFFDDLAGVAGGALSALAGVREEAEALVRARVDEAIRKLDLVRREDLEAVQDMAANARAGQEAAEARLSLIEERLMAIEGQDGDARGHAAHNPGTSEVDPASLPAANPVTTASGPTAGGPSMGTTGPDITQP